MKAIALAAAVALAAASFTPAQGRASPAVSPNVPLASFVYADLEKLDGLGYLPAMRPGTKPYTRAQAAAWVRAATAAAERRSPPPYVRAMLARLQAEFRTELQGDRPPAFALAGMAAGAVGRSGTTPLPIERYNDGYKYPPHANGFLELEFSGRVGDNAVVGLTPRVSLGEGDGDASLRAAYVKTRLGAIELEVGKDSVRWGQGFGGGLLLTDNATPLRLAKLTWRTTTLFYSVLEDDRTDVPYPSFAGLRHDFFVGADFTGGVAMTAMVGGKGHMLSRGDYWRLLKGENANSSAADKWNAIAGGDFRLRLPRWGGVQVYGELYGEDQACFMPSEVAQLVGVYIPRLSASGDWDLRLEWAHTRPAWYRHSLYTQGYTYEGGIMGDAMGANAYRYNARLTHYSAGGSSLTVNFERSVGDFTGPAPERRSALWLTQRCELGGQTWLDATAGAVRTGNLAHVAGCTATDYFASLVLTRRYR